MFHEGTGKVMNTIPPNDFGFYEMLNELVQQEPATSLDPELLGLAGGRRDHQGQAVCARRADEEDHHRSTGGGQRCFTKFLVNNASVLPVFAPFDEIRDTEWDRVMAVNVRGMWACCKAVVPAMRRQGGGRIVNMSSDTIWLGVPMLLHYVASKGALFALTMALARELTGTSINVNAITPGFTITEGTDAMADPATIAHIRAMVLDQQIVKRAELPPDVAGTLVFLVSDESVFITGQTINVNGGATHY